MRPATLATTLLTGLVLGVLVLGVVSASAAVAQSSYSGVSPGGLQLGPRQVSHPRQYDHVFVIGHYDCGMTGMGHDAILPKARAAGIDDITLATLTHAGIDLAGWLTGFAPHRSLWQASRYPVSHKLRTGVRLTCPWNVRV